MAAAKPKSKAERGSPSAKVSTQNSGSGRTSSKPKSPPTVVVADIVTDVPDPMSPEVAKQITQVRDFIGQADALTDNEIAFGVARFAGLAAAACDRAVKAGASALVHAWACGRLLNTAKERLGHGAFGRWRGERLVPKVMSERTSLRYMRLAASYHDVSALLEWNSGLRQAYVACGVLPDSSDQQAEDGTSNVKQTAGEKLVRTVMSLGKELKSFETNLAAFRDSKERLSKGDKDQLELMKGRIAKLAKDISLLLP